jgi:hypothetical protein
VGGSTLLAIAVSHSSTTTRGSVSIATVKVTPLEIALNPTDDKLLEMRLRTDLRNVPMEEALRGRRTCSKAMEKTSFTR